jgi:hypothetical protein
VYLTDTLGVLLRRWLLVGVGLALTLGVSYHSATGVGTDYQASGQLVLLLPADAEGVVPMNPYLNLQEGMSTAGALVASELMTPDAEATFVARGLTAEYDLALSPGTGPVVLVTAKSKDPQLALATRDAVIAAVQSHLATLQQDRGIPQRQLISAQPSNVPLQAEALPGSKLRALVGTAATGGLLVLLGSFVLDRFARVRRARRRARSAPGGGDEPPRPGRAGATTRAGELVGGR